MTLENFINKIPLAKKAEIIASHESGLIAINKGAGLLSHPNHNHDKHEKPSFVRAKYNFDREYFSWADDEGNKLHLHLINRLDAPTSGVILTAMNLETAKAAKLAFKNKTVKKIYHAICKNRPSLAKGQWADSIKKINTRHGVRAIAEGGGDLAITDFSMIRLDANGIGVSLMELAPITGKTHQLRIQCARRGMPIIGDATYGDFAANKEIKHLCGIDRLFLHCASTTISFAVEGKEYSFTAEAATPESFFSIIDYNGKILAKTKGFK